jgi:Domain of unknown function (DUF6777)
VDGKSPRKARTAWIAAALLAILVGVGVAGCGADGSEEAKGQTVTFQKPTQPGKKPFTKPADVMGTATVQVGSGPFGGTGSDLVCDRELLIRSLKAQPEKLREWARTVGISPDFETVARYIRELTPVTLTTDTRVTNHNFVNGRAVGYQSILQAGTAVLVDKDGIPRARCRCGNPLLEPIYYPKATCYGCPKNYTPPPPCQPYSKCYRKYPNPPPVKGGTATTPPPTDTTQTQPPPQTTTQTTTTQAPTNPQASFNRSTGHIGDQYTLSISGFSPNTQVPFTLTRPDGVQESHTISTDSSGSGSFSFNPSQGGDVIGTYTATAHDPATGGTASATTQLEP